MRSVRSSTSRGSPIASAAISKTSASSNIDITGFLKLSMIDIGQTVSPAPDPTDSFRVPDARDGAVMLRAA
jgi:hypothetical protein